MRVTKGFISPAPPIWRVIKFLKTLRYPAVLGFGERLPDMFNNNLPAILCGQLFLCGLVTILF
eukprot:6226483-Pyramimonas_sp.AAC.1